jgi:type III secretion protein I
MDITSVAGQAMQKALEQVGTTTPKVGVEASPEAVAALENAVNAQPHPQQPGAATPGTDSDLPVQAIHEVPHRSSTSLGDRILNGLGKLNEDSKAAIDQVEAAGAKVEMNPSDLLKAQYSLMQVSVQQDVTSKVVGKATQTLDTLLKNQ